MEVNIIAHRYCNMDYIFVSSVLTLIGLWIIASYDIACQFFKNFFRRIDSLPSGMHPSMTRFDVKILKAHIGCHGPSCQGAYSFNFTKGVGRTDGEGIERSWGWLNKAAPSVKEMGPSGRRETLDDFCGFANWRKTVGLGTSWYCLMLPFGDLSQ